MSCPASMARSTCGSTVWPNPTMPGNRSSPARILASRLRRSSSLTVSYRCPAARSSPRVAALGRGGTESAWEVWLCDCTVSTLCACPCCSHPGPVTVAARRVTLTAGATLQAWRSSPPRGRRRRSRRLRRPPRRAAAYPAAALPGAVRAARRTGVPQVREPAADRVVQGPRRVLADLPAERGRAGQRGGRGQRGQPRPGGGLRGRDPRREGHRHHAGGRAAAQDRGHPWLRGGHHLPRRDGG